jgi:phenylacetate-CoA ligase
MVALSMLANPIEILSAYRSANYNFKASPQQLEQNTNKALSQISVFAYTNSKYYRSLFNTCGLSQGVIKNSTELAKLPVLSRKEVVELGEQLMCTSVSDDLAWKQTSGTSGTPLRIPWSKEQLNAVIAVRLRFSSQMGLMPWHSIVWVHYKGKPRDTGSSEEFYEAYGKKFSPSIMWTNPSKLPGFGKRVSSLAEFKPHLLASWPSDLLRVGQIFEEQRRPISVKLVRPMGEALTKQRRTQLANLWHGEIFEAYGTSEFGLMANECVDHHGLHLNSDFFIFEVLYKDGATSTTGEGELVVTNLYNRALPLFRYNTRDLVVLSTQERCSCGTYLPLVTAFRGRFQDGLLSRQGRRVSAGRVMEAIESLLGNMEYQLTQVSSNEFTLAVPNGRIVEGLLEEIGSLLNDLVGDNNLRVIELIEQVGQKQRRVISNV